MTPSMTREDDGYSPELDAAEPEEQEEETEAVDLLADLDDATRAHVDALLSARETQTRQALRHSLNQAGLDVTENGAAAILDPQRVSSWLGVGRTGEPAPPPVPPPAVPEPEDETIPDPTMEPGKFKQWFDGQIKKSVQPFADALQANYRQARETAVEIALAKVGPAVQQFTPRNADLLTHPEFDQRMREALLTLDPQQWKDPKNLARVASMLVPDLDGAGGVPAKAPPRDEAGRFTDARDLGRSAISRATLAQTGPSKEAGRQRGGTAVSEVDQAIAARLSEMTGRAVSGEEVTLLRSDTTGDAAASLRKKRLDQATRRRS